MKSHRIIDWPYVIGLLLLPVFIAGIYLLIAWILAWTRYDPAYFSEDYRKRYSSPNDLLVDLETAIRDGDGELLAEVQGTRPAPGKLEKLSDVRFLIYWDGDQKYSNYLFMDMKNFHRYMQHVRLVNGRYVRVPDGAFYLADSGQWKTTFGPLAVIWWLLVILFTLGVWIYRSMAAYRQKMFGKPPGVV
jgi:hypothetical protein